MARASMCRARGMMASAVAPLSGGVHEDPAPTTLSLFETLSLLLSLAATLFKAVNRGTKWAIRFVQLILFVLLIIPSTAVLFMRYWTTSRIKRAIPYGTNPRNYLDIYTMPNEYAGKKVPVMVYVSGGAWIIGFRAWAFVMQHLAPSNGILLVSVDYRNFPQGTASDMMQDVCTAVAWVLDNVDDYGGDADQVSVVGQSAGAHLSMMNMISWLVAASSDRTCTRATAAARPTAQQAQRILSSLRSVVLVGGIFDVLGEMDYLHKRGLARPVLWSIFENDVEGYSVNRRLAHPDVPDAQDLDFPLPRFVFFHGTSDTAASYRGALDVRNELIRKGYDTEMTLYEGATHTSPILEDMIMERSRTADDFIDIIVNPPPRQTETNFRTCAAPPTPLIKSKLARNHNARAWPWTRFVLHLAKKMNPF